MKSNELVKFLLDHMESLVKNKAVYYQGNQAFINFLMDDEIVTLADLYRKVVDKLKYLSAPRSPALTQLMLKGEEVDFEYLSKFYLALIEDNNVVPAEVKFSVCRSLVDFGFIVEREYAELDPAVIASFNQTVQTFLSCVEKDLYAKRLSKESIEAKRVYLEEGSKLGLDTSQEDFYIHRFIPELQRIRLECREGNWFPPSMYFPFYRRQLQVFTEPLVAGLIKAIKGNPFEKKGEKAK